ncbi:MAG: UvrD-helicase domain-containing protein [Myxococcales bacterium]|nr:UvrD-helicase domain-containing protein [Myxococcales bacterium]
MTELNSPQQLAVAHESGPLLVFVGAGSGKTRVITFRVANLLALHQVPPYRILAVTFTNKAAGELKERLARLAGEAIVRDLWVGTFHSICVRLLRRYHEQVGLSRHFLIYDDSDQKALLGRIIKAEKLSDREYPPRVVLSRIHVHKREGRGPDDIKLTPNFDGNMVELYRKYQQALRAADAVDFEDLLVLGTQLAESDSPAGRDLRQRFDHVLVDEFQDTNQIQYRLVRALAASTQNLCVVGDDDQSIYSWRGADVRNIRGFRKDFPGAQVVKLEQNYRSSANIVAAALGVIERALEREPKQLFTQQPAGDPVRIRGVLDEKEEARSVVMGIATELQQGTDAREIAIFYRTHAQSRVLEGELRARNISYQIIGGTKFFDRAEVKDLLSYLRLIMNPRSDADLLRVVNTPTRGIGNKTLEALMDVARDLGVSLFDAIRSPALEKKLSKRACQALLRFHELIVGFRAEMDQLHADELAEQVLERSGYVEALKKQDTAEADARLENLQETVGSIREYLLEAEHLGQEPTLEAYLERVALIADVDSMQDQAPSVVLMTVHAAKGLEFEVVYLTGMEEGVFPYRGMDGDRDELEEERRLAYVALTRARRSLTLTHASQRMLFGRTEPRSPSRFLSDIPKEVAEEQGLGRRFGVNSLGGYSGRVDPYARRQDYDDFNQDVDYAGTTARGRMVSRSHAQPRGSGGRSSWQEVRSRMLGTAAGEPAAESSDEGRWVDTEAFDDVGDEAMDLRWMRPGARVYHERFGKGVIREVKPETPPRIVADFGGFGVRTVLATKLNRTAR